MMLSSNVGQNYLHLQRAQLSSEGLDFSESDGLVNALALGAFLLEVPSGLNLAPGIKMCQSFYKSKGRSDDLYTGHSRDPHAQSKLGYEDRPNQVEQLQIESHLWSKYFPSEVVGLLEQMKALTLATLKFLFKASGVDDNHWQTITGGGDGATSLCYTTLNHYRSEKRGNIGIVEHTDSGFITIIYVDKPGFEINVDGHWMPIKADPNCFIVNLGDAYEILTRYSPCRGAAVLHRVAETHPDSNGLDRSSFTVYMGPDFDMTLYQYSAVGELRAFQSFREFSILKSKGMGYRFHSRV
jgi:isopenicillin N synthase-like dioxygenase